MKKKIITLFLFVIFLILLFLGLEEIKYLVLKNQIFDYSKFPFSDVEWESGNEIIYFEGDGKFTYYDYSGSPVEDYDLCDTFVYDEISNKIKLICVPFEFRGNRLLRLVSVDDNILKLKFGNKIKTFRKVVDYSSFDYEFIQLHWIREEAGVKENLNIWDDGTIEYSYEIDNVDPKYEDCGTFDKKICKGEVYSYSYDDESETYTINCSIDLNLGEYYVYDENEKVISTYSLDDINNKMDIKIVYSDEKTLKLDFSGDIRKFKKISEE